jgi:hypothetical protein
MPVGQDPKLSASAQLGSEGLVSNSRMRGRFWIDAGRALAQAMAEFEDKTQRPLVIICGSLASKDTGGFLRPFKGLVQEVLAVPVNADQWQARRRCRRGR